MIILKTNGLLNEEGKIELDSIKSIYWKDLSDEKLPNLPVGTSIEISISFDENDLISGKKGFAWATYDSRQAEIVQNALLVQHINCEIRKIGFDSTVLHLISITNKKDTLPAVDFIWKNDTGLRLKPDWSYPKGETNKSFELWSNGH